PAGYMLAQADGGRHLTVQMCEGHGAAQVIDLDTGLPVHPSDSPDPDGQDAVKTPCVFASAVPMAPPLAADVAVEFATPGEVVVFAERDIRPGLGIPAPPPPATGPPAAI